MKVRPFVFLNYYGGQEERRYHYRRRRLAHHDALQLLVHPIDLGAQQCIDSKTLLPEVGMLELHAVELGAHLRQRFHRGLVVCSLVVEMVLRVE